MVDSQDEELLDEAREELLERVCAIDVAKDSGKVCVREPAPNGTGRRRSRIWDVPARTSAVLELGDHLVCQGVALVTVESTSDYWRIWYYLLEARGLVVQLVNARDVKNVPGRPKTDKLDAVWLAKLTERGMLRALFVPPAPIRVLRDYTRMRTDLTAERTRAWQRMEKLLEDALIKVSAVASRINTLSVREMIEALVAGQRDPAALAALARGRMRAKHADLIDALQGRFDDHHGELAQILLDQIDALTGHIEALTARIEELLAAMEGPNRPARDRDDRPAGTGEQDPAPAQVDLVALLDEIPGVSRHTAQVIIAEIGLDMTRFPTADHLVSWAKLSPRSIQSGPVRRGGRTGKGDRYLRAVLGEAAAAAARTNTFLGQRYRRLVKRRGKPKALVAIARSILVTVWHLLTNPTAGYRELGPDYYIHRQDPRRQLRNHIHALQTLGYTVTITPAA